MVLFSDVLEPLGGTALLEAGLGTDQLSLLLVRG